MNEESWSEVYGLRKREIKEQFLGVSTRMGQRLQFLLIPTASFCDYSLDYYS
jgi:hypothetical protein